MAVLTTLCWETLFFLVIWKSGGCIANELVILSQFLAIRGVAVCTHISVGFVGKIPRTFNGSVKRTKGVAQEQEELHFQLCPPRKFITDIAKRNSEDATS